MAQYGQENPARRPLLIAAGVLLLIVVVVYGIRLLPSGGPPAAKELARLALEADSPEEREKAAIQLTDAEGLEALEHLRRVATESKDANVRAVCIREIGDRCDYESMDLLLAALDDESPLVRARAAKAVAPIIGREYPYRFNAPKAERQPTIDAIRACWEQMKGSEPMMEGLKKLRDQAIANKKGGD
jgi:hypothetical protein